MEHRLPRWAAGGFIDWDAAGPATPLTDLAAAAWAFVPLAPADQLLEAGFTSTVPGGAGALADMADRLAVFVAAYGLADPLAILPELVTAELNGTETISYRAPDAPGAADLLEHTARRIRFIHSVMPILASALQRL